jgi:hypothetical protein
MKHLPFYLLSAFLCLVSVSLFAQAEHKVSVDGKTIVFEEIDHLTLVGYDGKDLKISRASGGNSNVDDRANGLRKISAGGKTDNTGFGLNSQEVNGEVVISQVGKGDGKILIQVPNSAVVRVEQSTYRGGDLSVSNFKGELDVSMHYHKAILSNVYGPLSVNTIYGSIEATFSGGPPTEDIRLHSTYQDVDLTLPNNTSADLRLNTSYGSMYTDFDLDVKANMDEGFKKDDHNHEEGHGHCHEECKGGEHDNGWLTGSINGGGKLISVTASYKNIYLRKLK